MTDIKLFALDTGSAKEILGSATALEKSLQHLIERNLEAMLGIRFLESEYSTGPKHGGRIDTLGLDENARPVIIEYKRATNENVINQGLSYMTWLLDHRAEYQLLVSEKLGEDEARSIDWTAPRLLCIAGEFRRHDEHAVQQMNRDIELIRYRRFGENLLMLELVTATVAKQGTSSGGVTEPPPSNKKTKKTMSERLEELDGPLQDLHHALRAHLMALGDDVQEKTLNNYVAFKRLRNFARVKVRSTKAAMIVYLNVNPDTITLELDFTRDIRKVGGYGDLEVTIRTLEDLERSKPLLQMGYEAN